MELKYDKDIRKIEEEIDIREQRIVEIENSVDILNENKGKKQTIIQNRIEKLEEEIIDLEELQKPISVGLVL